MAMQGKGTTAAAMTGGGHGEEVVALHRPGRSGGDERTNIGSAKCSVGFIAEAVTAILSHPLIHRRRRPVAATHAPWRMHSFSEIAQVGFESFHVLRKFSTLAHV